eukprot:s65_g34.t1
MYHLADAPIRAMLIWTDYDLMLDEIRRHFSYDGGVVVDAYEVNVQLTDLPEGATAIIVHLLSDLPIGRPMCLPLFDIETHGHRIERHFRIGPTVQRLVLPTPDSLVGKRDAFLGAIQTLLAKIHQIFSRRGFDLNMQKGKTTAGPQATIPIELTQGI